MFLVDVVEAVFAAVVVVIVAVAVVVVVVPLVAVLAVAVLCYIPGNPVGTKILSNRDYFELQS